MDDSFHSLWDSISVQSPDAAHIVALLVAIVLLGCSAFASASEIAYFSLSPADKKALEDDDSPANRKVRNLLATTDRLLATILITNNFINVTVVILCNYFFASVFSFGSPVAEFLVITVILTFLLLLFGEIMPKIYSSQRPLAFARFAAPGLLFCRALFRPVASLLMKSSGFVNRHLSHKRQAAISVDELSQALELTDRTELSEEKNILEGIVRFGKETVREVMTSRLDMVDLDIRAPFEQVLQCVVDNAYSRIPVYAGTQDNIKGVLYIKDLLPHINKGAHFRWQSLIRPAYFVPETKKIDDLLRDFQTDKIHIAIVADEFGGTSGIITMEDIMEEIVGEIHDEYDDDEQTYTRLNDTTWLFEGKTLLTDFYRITEMDDEVFDKVSGDADTIAGLLLEMTGEFPTLHQKLHYADCEFEVMAADNRRILQVKFTKQSPADAALPAT
ncbi:MAG: gliding motility-associated protein GldE [Prevotellaceae bacterium]|jgi:gliding motility-associated protein GldE|nr:gliding motility-associated protein GldE [Prevotellaceae bacterium]